MSTNQIINTLLDYLLPGNYKHTLLQKLITLEGCQFVLATMGVSKINLVCTSQKCTGTLFGTKYFSTIQQVDTSKTLSCGRQS